MYVPHRAAEHCGNAQGKERQGIDVHMIPNCGHCPMDDTPDLVAELLMPWLSRHHTPSDVLLVPA